MFNGETVSLVLNLKFKKMKSSVPLSPCACVHAQSLSRVWLFVTPRTVALQVPLSVEFFLQEYWRGLPFPPPGDLPDPGVEPVSPVGPALVGGFFTTEPHGNYICKRGICKYKIYTIILAKMDTTLKGMFSKSEKKLWNPDFLSLSVLIFFIHRSLSE